MAFSFPLESVLRLRASRERQEQALLEISAQKMRSAQEHCELLKKQRIDLDEEFQAQLVKGTTSADLYYYQAAKAGLERAEAEAGKAFAEIRQQWNEQRLKFLEARRDREVISSAKQNSYEAYLKQQARREQQQVDDLFAMRGLRQSG